MSVFKTDLFEGSRKLISIIDDLRDYGLDKQITLPRIAVLGTQSSGKSSLLENVVGLDFLPRGTGTVTRRPLELRLVHVEGKAKGAEAVFEADRSRRYTNFEEVRQKIVALTDEIGKNIVDDPIKLTIFSTECPNLTLIDLPGITRLAMKGQQEDIERVTTEMAGRYCKESRTIILCVINANQDMATSDGIKLALEFDPEGERTIGVITKIDIMDKGTDAQKMLLNQEIKLRLGFVGIKNRCQEDIANKVPVSKSLVDEENYFKAHPVYRNLSGASLGTKSLTSKLSGLLVKQIGKELPNIVAEIKQRIRDQKSRLERIGSPLPNSNTEKINYLIQLIKVYSDEFGAIIKGKYDPNRNREKGSEKVIMEGGAKIKEWFMMLFKEYAEEDFDCTKSITAEQIETAIISHQGDQLSGFPSMDLFKALVLPQIQTLQQPAEELVENVFGYLSELCEELNHKIFERFVSVEEAVAEISSKILIDRKEYTLSLIDSLIRAETNFIFTNDDSYNSFAKELVEKAIVSKDRMKLFISEIRERVKLYFRIIVRSLKDSVPKVIGHFLVNASTENLLANLQIEITTRSAILDSLGESRDIMEERKKVSANIDVLTRCLNSLRREPAVKEFLRD